MFLRVFIGYFPQGTVDSLLHADDVRSDHTIDSTRVPAQKVYNYRSDRWITLKVLLGVFVCFFTWSSMESVLHANKVWSGPTTATTRVLAQKVHNYRSNRWMALKLFSGVSIGFFTRSSVESVVHADDIRSGHTSDTTRVPAQKVYNYRSDRWMALD